jgi:hypothetical protein
MKKENGFRIPRQEWLLYRFVALFLGAIDGFQNLVPALN